MGDQHVENGSDPSRHRAFMRAMLNDLRALEQMLDAGRFEEGVRRVGAEQEMFLVDRHMRPAPVAPEVIASAADPRLTTEIARFNLEANLTPRGSASARSSRGSAGGPTRPTRSCSNTSSRWRAAG